MKLKYYLNNRIISLIFISFIISIVVINNANAAILTSSSSPTKIFKCGASAIAATFNDGGIVSVDAVLTSKVAVLPGWSIGSNVLTTESTTVSMTNNGTYWVGTFGNDATLLWGGRSITYIINGVTSYSSSSEVFIYSDKCTGTGVTNYAGVSSGLGRYTSMIYGGTFTFFGTTLETSLIGWALYPWVEIWGYIFYLLVIFTICVTIYLKTQNVTQPLVIGIFLLLIFASSAVVPIAYRQWILFVIALLMSAIYYKIFVRD